MRHYLADKNIDFFNEDRWKALFNIYMALPVTDD